MPFNYLELAVFKKKLRILSAKVLPQLAEILSEFGSFLLQWPIFRGPTKVLQHLLYILEYYIIITGRFTTYSSLQRSSMPALYSIQWYFTIALESGYLTSGFSIGRSS